MLRGCRQLRHSGRARRAVAARSGEPNKTGLLWIRSNKRLIWSEGSKTAHFARIRATVIVVARSIPEVVPIKTAFSKGSPGDRGRDASSSPHAGRKAGVRSRDLILHGLSFQHWRPPPHLRRFQAAAARDRTGVMTGLRVANENLENAAQRDSSKLRRFLTEITEVTVKNSVVHRASTSGGRATWAVWLYQRQQSLVYAGLPDDNG